MPGIFHVVTPTHFAIISYTVLAIFFYLTLIDRFLRIKVLASIPLFWFMSKVYILSQLGRPESLSELLSNVVESIFICYWCFAYFRELLNHDKHYRPEKDRTFWVVVGLLFYFIGDFFIAGLLRHLWSTNEILAHNASSIGYLFNYLLYGIIILICFINFPLTNYE